MSKVLVVINGQDNGVVYEMEAFELSQGMTKDIDTIITFHGVSSSVEINSLDSLAESLEGEVDMNNIEVTGSVPKPSGSGILEDAPLNENSSFVLTANPHLAQVLHTFRTQRQVILVEDYDPDTYNTLISKVVLKTVERPFIKNAGYQLSAGIQELVELERFNSNGRSILIVSLPTVHLTTNQKDYYISETIHVVEKKPAISKVEPLDGSLKEPKPSNLSITMD